MTVSPLLDHAGHRHAPADAGARVLSLVPSLTELMFDLGLAKMLVGRTHYCIHPAPAVESIPSVGGTKKIVHERVRELAPTHAIVNVDENPKDMAAALSDMGIIVIVTHPMHPDDNPALYRLIGGIFGANAEANNLTDNFASARQRLAQAAAGLPAWRAIYLIWKDPWMGIGLDTYIANMLALADIRVVATGNDGDRYPRLTLTDDLLVATDLVLFSSEPYAFSASDIGAFRRAHPAHALKAHAIDGEMTSWYGSRAIRAMDELAKFAQTLPR